MNKKHLIAVGSPSPPFAFECFDKTSKNFCPAPGIEVEYLQNLLDLLNFSVSFLKVNDSSEMEKLIEIGKANISAITVELKGEILLKNNFVAIQDGIDFLIFLTFTKETFETVKFLLFKMITWEVWTLMLACTIAVCFKVAIPEF